MEISKFVLDSAKVSDGIWHEVEDAEFKLVYAEGPAKISLENGHVFPSSRLRRIVKCVRESLFAGLTNNNGPFLSCLADL